MNIERRTMTFRNWIAKNTMAFIFLLGFIITWIMYINQIPTIAKELKDNICPRLMEQEKKTAIVDTKLDNMADNISDIKKILEKYLYKR